jgi:hypothetical protein
MSSHFLSVVFLRIRDILVDFLNRDAILYTLRERTKTKTPRSNGSNSVSGDGRGGCAMGFSLRF